MPLQFTDEEIKKGAAKVLEHNDRAAIARASGIHSKIVKDNFNPESERKSFAFLVLSMACALADRGEERADEYMDLLRYYYEQSKRRQTVHFETSKEAARFAVLASATMSGRLLGNSIFDQLVDLRRARRQTQRLERALLDDIASETPGLLTPPELMAAGKNGILPVHVRELAQKYRSQPK